MDQEKSFAQKLDEARKYADMLALLRTKKDAGLHWDWEGYALCRYCFGATVGQYGIAESVAFWCSEGR